MNRYEGNASSATLLDEASVFSAAPSYFDHWQDTADALFIVAVHEDGVFTFEGVNPACERMSGYSNAEYAGRTPEQLLPPADAALVTARYRQCVREGKAISYLESLDFSTGLQDWRTSLEPVRDASGRIVRLLGRARWLEHPDLAPEDLTEGEFRKALDVYPLGLALLDERGVILHVNATWRNFGQRHGSSGDEVGHEYLEVCDRPTSAGLPQGAAVADKLRQLIAEDGGQFGHAYTWQNKHFVLRAARIVLNGRVRVTMAHQDVTDIVRARHQQEQLMEQVLQAQEEERARIALEIHDSTAQHLVALGLSMAALRDTNVPPQVLADMRHSLAEAHREIRTLAYLLYPPKLQSQGLVATVQGFIEGFRRRTGLTTKLTTAGKLDGLSFDIQRTVFRIVQEALANVHRHADAQQARVTITLRPQGLRVTITDDGPGRNAGAERTVGVGIRGMQARLAQFGGELTVTHRASGTTVDGFLPQEKLGPAEPATD